MKTYTFEVVIKEGNDEFWKDIIKHNKTGCEDVKNVLDDFIFRSGFDYYFKLIKYEDK